MAPKRAAGARLLALLLHRAFEAGRVEREAPLAGEILDEVARHTPGVVQPERLVAGQQPGARRGRAVDQLLEARQPRLEHRLEPLLLGPDEPLDVGLLRRGAPGRRAPIWSTSTSTRR